jgi:hypothetical protein
MKKLERKEMKKVNGGALPPPPKTLWSCLIEPTWYHNVCYSVQPQAPCGYSQPCTAIGTCTASGDYCVH